MAFPVILYRSIFRNTGAIITASSTDTGFSVANISDMRPWIIWKSGTLVTGITIDLDLGASGAVSADTLGLVNHNLVAEGGTIEVKSGATFPPTDDTPLAAMTPDSDEVALVTMTPPAARRYWRVTLAKGGNFVNKPYIGDLWIGLRTTMPQYLDADIDPYMTDVEAVSQRGKTGHFLGVVLRGKQHRDELRFGGPAGMPRTFYTSDFEAVLTHIRQRKPFFFQIDSADGTWKVPFFLKLPDAAKAPTKAVGGVYTNLKTIIPFEEAWMERA